MAETFVHNGGVRLHVIRDGGDDGLVPLLIVPGLGSSGTVRSIEAPRRHRIPRMLRRTLKPACGIPNAARPLPRARVQ